MKIFSIGNKAKAVCGEPSGEGINRLLTAWLQNQVGTISNIYTASCDDSPHLPDSVFIVIRYNWFKTWLPYVIRYGVPDVIDTPFLQRLFVASEIWDYSQVVYDNESTPTPSWAANLIARFPKTYWLDSLNIPFKIYMAIVSRMSYWAWGCSCDGISHPCTHNNKVANSKWHTIFAFICKPLIDWPASDGMRDLYIKWFGNAYPSDF